MVSERIAGYIRARESESERIPTARRECLEQLADFVRSRVSNQEPARLTFICTHNSRRSHLSQIWARTAAMHHGVEGVETYSGGTEATAFNSRAVEAMKRAGFEIERRTEGDNPVYGVRHEDEGSFASTFSKVYDQAPNPSTDFCAVMTCSRADGDCPVVPGATRRVAIPYEDPGDHDGTEREQEAYDDCCRKISREMLFLFSCVKRPPTHPCTRRD